MSTSRRAPATPKQVETIVHGGERRTHLPPAEFQPLAPEEVKAPIRVVIERRNRDLPRLTLSITGKAALLRGAAALAFSNVLKPRIGAAGDEDNDPLRHRAKAEKAA